METKKEKFVRLAESRTNSIIQKIHLIGNLANRRNYDYTEKEVDEIFKAIENEIKKTKKVFEIEMQKKETSFKFSDRKD